MPQNLFPVTKEYIGNIYIDKNTSKPITLPQKNFYEDVKDYLENLDVLKEIEKEIYAEDVEKSHSKIITRRTLWA